MGLLIWWHGICQRLENLHNSVNHSFPDNQCMALYSHRVEDLFKVQGHFMDSSVTEYEKFIVGGSNSTQQLTRKKLCSSSLGVVSKNSHKYLKRLLKYSSLFQWLNWVRLTASCDLAQTAHLVRETAEADRRAQLSAVKPPIREICRCVAVSCFSVILFWRKIFWMKMLLIHNGFIIFVYFLFCF